MSAQPPRGHPWHPEMVNLYGPPRATGDGHTRDEPLQLDVAAAIYDFELAQIGRLSQWVQTTCRQEAPESMRRVAMFVLFARTFQAPVRRGAGAEQHLAACALAVASVSDELFGADRGAPRMVGLDKESWSVSGAELFDWLMQSAWADAPNKAPVRARSRFRLPGRTPTVEYFLLPHPDVRYNDDTFVSSTLLLPGGLVQQLRTYAGNIESLTPEQATSGRTARVSGEDVYRLPVVREARLPRFDWNRGWPTT